MLSGTVNAGLGLRPATVPFLALDDRFDEDCCCCWPPAGKLVVRFRESSDSIFLRIACSRPEIDFLSDEGALMGVTDECDRES